MHDLLQYSHGYAPPGDRIRLHTNDPRVFGLADRLWMRVGQLQPGAHGGGELHFALAVVPDAGDVIDVREQWTVESSHIELEIPGVVHVRTDLQPPLVTGRVAASFLAAQPADVGRLMLETPAAELLARRGYTVAHAGTVVGPGGAVVIRGRSGAGKSTLVAAAQRAGFEVLGDETILVARDDPDDLAATVRDLTVLPDTARLLGLEAVTTPVVVGDRQKRRLDLFSTSTPGLRRARRLTTVLLGERGRLPVRLVPLTAAQFVAEFRGGAIPQERWAADPDLLATAWGERGGYRLDGASDLSGALDLLRQLTGARHAVERAS